MKGINRRRFLQIAGAGSIAAATAGTAAGVPGLTAATRLAATSKQGKYTFRAVTGLPSKPLPSYASYVLEGHVDLTTHTGVMTKTVFAGHPESMSTVALPGLSRIIRITDVQALGGTYRVKGIVDDRSQLQAGESRNVNLLIDPIQGIVRTSSFGTNMMLQLEG
jgi:hypothetical protein